MNIPPSSWEENALNLTYHRTVTSPENKPIVSARKVTVSLQDLTSGNSPPPSRQLTECQTPYPSSSPGSVDTSALSSPTPQKAEG